MSKHREYPRTGLTGWLSILKWEGMREVDRTNERRVNLRALLWAGSMIAVALLVKSETAPAPWSWLLAAVPVALGLLALKAYLKLLREMDEMMRRIQLEALAVGFGAALIIGSTLIVLDAVPREFIAPAILAPMCFAFSLRVILAARDVAHDAAEREDADA